MDIKKFKYSPEVHYISISEKDSQRVIPLLDIFKKGYLFPLESHILNSDGLSKLLASSVATPEIHAEFRQVEKEVERELLNIVRYHTVLKDGLQPHQLETEAQRGFYHYFRDVELDKAKLDFCKMIKTYELIKTFNNQVRESWTYIQNVFEKSRVNSANESFLEQVLVYKVYPRLELCDLTDLLLRRMAYILRVKKEDHQKDHVTIQAEYTSQVDYTLSSLYRTDLADVLDENVTNFQKKAQEKVRESCIKGPYLLDSRGEEMFNQNEAYILKMNPDRVQADEIKIKNSSFVELHMGQQDRHLRRDLIRNFVSRNKNRDWLQEYKDFLNEYFNYACQKIVSTFLTEMLGANLADKDKNIFLYHFGPPYFTKIILRMMRDEKTGFIHRSVARGKMVRELPYEYIKYILKDWWDTEVYQKVTKHERNSQDFKSNLIMIIRANWRDQQSKIVSKMAEEPILLRAFRAHDHKALRPFIEVEIGHIHYQVYNRYLGHDFLYITSRMATSVS